MKLGGTGPFDMPRRTSIPWWKSTGLTVSESRGSARNEKILVSDKLILNSNTMNTFIRPRFIT